MVGLSQGKPKSSPPCVSSSMSLTSPVFSFVESIPSPSSRNCEKEKRQLSAAGGAEANLASQPTRIKEIEQGQASG